MGKVFGVVLCIGTSARLAPTKCLRVCVCVCVCVCVNRNIRTPSKNVSLSPPRPWHHCRSFAGVVEWAWCGVVVVMWWCGVSGVVVWCGVIGVAVVRCDVVLFSSGTVWCGGVVARGAVLVVLWCAVFDFVSI